MSAVSTQVLEWLAAASGEEVNNILYQVFGSSDGGGSGSGGSGDSPSGSNEGAGSKLPKTTEESINTKLDTYLLEPTHLTGGSKANWFKQALGFDRSNASVLEEQIKFDPRKATPTVMTQYGQKYEQVIKITGANGRTIDVNFVWIHNNDGVVRFVTSIPTKK